MCVRPEETHLTPEWGQSTTMSGTREQLIDRLCALKEAGYQELTVQVVHGHESALEEWAEVFARVV